MANSTTYKHVKGIADLSATLRALPEDMRSKTLVAGVKAACKPIHVAMRRFAKRSERTGALRESLTIKAVGYHRSGKAVGLVGPDKAYYAGRRKAGKLTPLLAKTSRPSNYAHLVEYGHNVVAPAKGTSIRKGTSKGPKPGKKQWVPAKPFIRPAVMTTAAQQSQEFSGIAKGFEAERRRLVKSGTHSN